MKFQNVSIRSLTHVDAPHRITSQEIEARLAPTFERLGMRPGVLRRFRKAHSPKLAGSSGCVWMR